MSKVIFLGIFMLMSFFARQYGFENAETVISTTATDSESCKKTTEDSSLFSASSSSESGGCGCSGTSGGLKRDSVLGSLDTSTGGTETKEPASSSSSSSSTSTSTKEDHHTPESLYKYNLDTMVYLEGGTFYMGTDHPKILTDGEGPKRLVTLSDFLIDKYEVSNDEYRKFVDSTGYRTESEFFGWSFVFESAVPAHLKAQITQAVLGAEWWLPVNGSYWREPEGPGTHKLDPVPYNPIPTILFLQHILHIHAHNPTPIPDQPKEPTYFSPIATAGPSLPCRYRGTTRWRSVAGAEGLGCPPRRNGNSPLGAVSRWKWTISSPRHCILGATNSRPRASIGMLQLEDGVYVCLPFGVLMCCQ